MPTLKRPLANSMSFSATVCYNSWLGRAVLASCFFLLHDTVIAEQQELERVSVTLGEEGTKIEFLRLPSTADILPFVSSRVPPVFSAKPDDRQDATGDKVELTLNASLDERAEPDWSAEGLPAGVSIDSFDGTISGTISDDADAQYMTIVKVTNGPHRAETSFKWTIIGGGSPNGGSPANIPSYYRQFRVLSKYPSEATYLAETELSAKAFKHLLGPEKWNAYKRRLMALNSIDKESAAEAEYKAIIEGSDGYPVICVSLDEIITICKRLHKTNKINGLTINPEYEETMFRIPSRAEWMFAAFSAKGAPGANAHKHFPKWVDYDAVNYLPADITLLAENAYDIRSPDRPNLDDYREQNAFLELVDKAEEKDLTKDAYRILGRILKASIGFEIDISKSSEAGLRTRFSEHPDDWGFHRMLGNAPEWVLHSRADYARGTQSYTRIKKHWNTLSTTEDLNTIAESDVGLLMGGSFVDLMNDWKQYSIHGGYPSPLEDDFQPYNTEACLREGDGVQSNGGIRLLIDRKLLTDWFITYRRKILNSPSPETSHRLSKELSTVLRDILPESTQEAHLELVDFLAVFRSNEDPTDPGAWRDFAASMASIDFDSIGPIERRVMETAASEKKAVNPLAALKIKKKKKKQPNAESNEKPNPMARLKFKRKKKEREDALTKSLPEKLDYFMVTQELAGLPKASN